MSVAGVSNAVDAVNGKLETTESPRKKLLPPTPAKWNSVVVMLGKLGFVAWLATQLGRVVIPGLNMTISGAVYALVLGIIFTSIGFLDENALNKSNSYGIVMFALMMYIFDGLKDCTPQMLGSIIADGHSDCCRCCWHGGIVLRQRKNTEDPVPAGLCHRIDCPVWVPAQCNYH